MKNNNTIMSIRLMGSVFVLAILLGLGGRAQGQSIHVQYPDTVRYVHADVPFDTITVPFNAMTAYYTVGADLAFIGVFHCDEPVEIAGVAFSGPLNETRHKDAKAMVYLLGFDKQSGSGEMIYLDSSLYNAEKEPVILEYPFTTGGDSTVTPVSLPQWEMLFPNTHVVSDSFAVAVVNYYTDDRDELYIDGLYINPLRYGNFLVVELSPNHGVKAEHDYTVFNSIGNPLNYPGFGSNNHRTIGQILDTWGLDRTHPATYAFEGLFEPIRATDCPKMESVHIDSVDMTQAWLSWPSCDSAATYRVEYMLHGGYFGDGQWMTGITDTFCCIEGLQPGMAYDFYVQAFCPRQKQYGLPSTPTTAVLGDVVTCPDVDGLRIAWRNRELGVLSLAFDSLDEHARYQISVCPYGCDDPALGHIYDVDENPYYIFDLDTNTYYAAYVRAQCSHECYVHHDLLVWSDWSRPIYFYLGVNNPLDITTAEAAAFTVVPNPAREYVAVTLSGSCDVAHTLLTLRDASGKELRRLAPTAATVEMPLQGLAAGTYFLTLATPQGSSTQKLVIEP